MSVPNMEFFQIKCLFYWIKFVNYIKLFKIQGTGCYNINVTFISSQKDGLLKYVECEFRHVFSFSCIWKKDGKVFSKNTVTFWHNIACKVNTFVFHYIWELRLIAYKSYSTFCTSKCKINVLCIAIRMTHQWLTLIPIWHC